MIVVDSSVVVAALLGSLAGGRIADEDLCAPHLIDAEIGNAFRRLTQAGRIDATSASQAIVQSSALEILRYGHTAFASRAWELRDNLTFYDALYVALAEALDVPLVTMDRALAGAPGAACAVEVLSAHGG